MLRPDRRRCDADVILVHEFKEQRDLGFQQGAGWEKKCLDRS